MPQLQPYLIVTGGMYENVSAGSLIKQIMDSAEIQYSIHPDLALIPISGYIQICTHREALQQICFAIGASADCSRSTIINIVPQTDEMTSIIGIDRKFIGQKTKLDDLVTGIQTTAHSYSRTNETLELFNGELAPGTHQIVFSEPAYNVAATGGVIQSITVNSAVIVVNQMGTVILSGKKYLDSQQTFSQSMSKVVSNSAPNVLKVETATLVGTSSAIKVTSLVFNYYQNRYRLEFRFIPAGERVGDLVMVETLGGGRLRGWIEQMKYDLTGGYLVDCVVTGKPVEIIHADYMDEIYMSDDIGVI